MKKVQREFVPIFSANYTAGFVFLHAALVAVTKAFVGGKK